MNVNLSRLSTLRQLTLVPLLVAVLQIVVASAHAQTVHIADTVIAPKSRVGINVNGLNSWYNFVGANLIDNSCFEPVDSIWSWGVSNSAVVTTSADTSTFTSGKQSMKLVVTGAPVRLQQGRSDPQAPCVLQVTSPGRYVIKAQIKASTPTAGVRLAIMVGGWSPIYGPLTKLTTNWATYSWTYVRDSNEPLVPLIGFAIELRDNATYWVDDFIAWDANDIDRDTGLSATYVARLKEMKPATLRLGGLGVNGIPLESYLFQPWDGCDLRLMSSLNDVSGIPTEGKNLIIVAAVNNVLHFRIFDGDCKVVVDTDEKRLTEQARQIEDLKKQLEGLWPPHQLTRSEKEPVIAAVTSIVGHTPWDLSYGPPAFAPGEMGLNTFLKLCQVVGADPFLTVPPAFSDADHAACGDLTEDIVKNRYTDHGNLVDYLGGDASTPYGARREADGYTRWDQKFSKIYMELGNELWGTPDGKWDMNLTGSDTLPVMQERFVCYNQKRMTEMRGRPGWRANMRVGFCGQSPEIWIGDYDGCYNKTVVPRLKELTDFSTVYMYYGPTDPSTPDDALYGDLFAHGPWFQSKTKALRDSFEQAAGKQIETDVYEGNAVNPKKAAYLDPKLYFKEVSLGAAVSLVDSIAAGNAAGIADNNLFHFNSSVWATITGYPQSYRKPSFFAVKLFTNEIAGNMVACTVEGSDTYDSNLEGELRRTPYVACYAYKNNTTNYILLVNRHRSAAQNVTVAKPLSASRIVELTASDINANNENGEIVTLTTQDLGGVAVDNYVVTVPPFSAFLLVGDDLGPGTRAPASR